MSLSQAMIENIVSLLTLSSLLISYISKLAHGYMRQEVIDGLSEFT